MGSLLTTGKVTQLSTGGGITALVITLLASQIGVCE